METIEQNKDYAKKIQEEYKDDPDFKIEIKEGKVFFVPKGNLKIFLYDIRLAVTQALKNNISVERILAILQSETDHIESVFKKQE